MTSPNGAEGSSLRPKNVREGAKWAGGLLGAAATAIGALATLGVIGGSAPDEALAKASTNLRDAGTSALVVKVRLPEPEGGERFAARLLGTGELDYSSGRGQFSYQVEFPNLEESWDIDVTFDGSVLYARLPAEWGLSRDRPWLRADLDELQRLDSEDADVRVALLARLNFEDVSGLLDYLDEAGDVEKVGEDTTRGVHTTRYDGTVDVGGGESGPKADTTVKLSAWLDDQETLRRLLLTLPDGSVADLELSDFGTPVETPKPDAAEVISLEDLSALP